MAQTYARARTLCQQADANPQLFWVLRGLCMFYLVRAELQTALELAEQLLSLAERIQDQILLIEAHYVLGNTVFWLGEFARARTHVEYGLALYNPQRHHALALASGEDPGVGCLAYAAWSLWHLGYPDQALTRCHEALALARQLAHPFSLARALHHAVLLHHNRRDTRAVAECVAEVITLSRQQGFTHRVATSTIYQG